jgi:predicted TIM-barrel fold metal-dependent hydrolase
MLNGLHVVDFHAHLQDCQTQLLLCKEDRETLFFRHAVPWLEQLAHLSEPIHDEFLRFLALNYRGPISRFVYSSFGQVGLMETLRLFKTYGIERLLRSMQRNGIDHVVIHSIEPLTATANILDQTRRYPGRFSVFASVARGELNPVGYFSKFVEQGVISGLKIHPLVGGFACGELYHATKDLVYVASEAGLPVLIHTGHIPSESLKGLTGCNEVEGIEPLIANFPHCKFILAHIGWESWRQVLHLAHSYPNVIVETSWQPARIIRRAVDLLGPERVLFGSDFPLFRQSIALAQLKKALTAREFVMVASTNGARLLRLSERKQPQQAS